MEEKIFVHNNISKILLTNYWNKKFCNELSDNLIFFVIKIIS